MSTYTINIPESEVDIDIDTSDIAQEVAEKYGFAQEVAASMDIDYSELADNLDTSGLAQDVAEKYGFAQEVSESVADRVEIDYYDLAQNVDAESVAEYIAIDAESVAEAMEVDVDAVAYALVDHIPMDVLVATVAHRILDTLTSNPELEQRNKELSLDLQRATDEVNRLQGIINQPAQEAPTPQPYDVPLSTGEGRDWSDRYGF